MHRTNKKRLLLGGLVVVVGAVLAACGGGNGVSEGRAQPLGLEGVGSVIAWSPSPLAFSINPGGRQEVPVTFTSSAALTNVAVKVVAELRNIVSVSPTSFAALTPGQRATVTVTVAPGASETYRTVDGTIHLLVGSSTIAKPLPVSLALVSAETINGVSVPPSPPTVFNSVTLAGFDTNGNGVRDDVERLIADQYGTDSTKFNLATSVAKAMQKMLVAPSETSTAAYGNALRCIFDNVILRDVIVIERAMLSTGARKSAYGDAIAGTSLDEEGC